MTKTFRLGCVALAALLLLCACAQRQDDTQAVAQGGGPDEDALFPYYSISGNSDYYGRSNWGLLNAKGEFVLPQEYSYIGDISTYDYMLQEMPAHEDRFFVAQQYEEITEDMRRLAEEQGYADIDALNALVSPQGELLTDFQYALIATWPDEDRFIAVGRPDNRIVWLDRSGAETPVTESDVEQAVRENSRWVFGDYGYSFERPGPDVPEYGFENVVDLPDGRYWGAYTYSEAELAAMGEQPAYDWDTEEGTDTYGKDIWETRYYLYTAGGERIGDAYFNHFGEMGDGLYCAGTNVGYSYEDTYYTLTDENGVARNDEVYGSVWYGYLGPYFVTRQGETVKVFEMEGLKLRHTMQVGADDDVWPSNENGMYYLNVSGLGQVPRLFFFGEEEGEIALGEHAGYSISEFNDERDRFVISRIIDWDSMEDGEDPAYNVMLVGLDGTVYLDGRTSLYSTYGVLVDTEERGTNWVNNRAGLYDWDGNELLPHEYSTMDVRYGGAAHVRRGDWTGLIDLQGNWIYRESVFGGLE